MKRDKDLIRTILLELEAAENLHGVVEVQARSFRPIRSPTT
jgi:hypothetical protein